MPCQEERRLGAQHRLVVEICGTNRGERCVDLREGSLFLKCCAGVDNKFLGGTMPGLIFKKIQKEWISEITIFVGDGESPVFS